MDPKADAEGLLKEGLADGFAHTCRSCLVSTPEVRSLFSLGSGLADQLWQCTEVLIAQDDGLPTGLCPTCHRDLSKAYDFRIRCRQSNTLLCDFRPQREQIESKVDPPPPPAPPAETDSNYDPLDMDTTAFDDDDSGNVKKEEGEGEEVKPHECDVCGKRFRLLGSLEAHKEEVHGIEQIYACVACGKSFNRNSSLLRHIKEHRDSGKYSCSACGQTLSTRKALKLHLKSHLTGKKIKAKKKRIKTEERKPKVESDDGATYKNVCSICDKPFKWKSQLETHLQTHVEERPYECDVCGKRFRLRPILKAHMKELHDTRHAFSCLVCEKRFSRNSNLRRHALTHRRLGARDKRVALQIRQMTRIPSANGAAGAEKPKLACATCGEQFRYRSHLEEHVKGHTGEKPFQCDACGKLFRLKGHLKGHKEAVHDLETAFACDACARSFNSKSNLRRHLRTHDAAAAGRYACGACDERAPTRRALRAHAKACHQGDEGS